MATDGYTIGWLQPDDAESVARLEADIYPLNNRAGASTIWAQLVETAVDGRNLSLGLYRGDKLVGFALAFLARNRREIADFFDAPLPSGLEPERPVLYVADFAVHPRHRRATVFLVRDLQRIARARSELGAIGFDAFSTQEYAAIWTARKRFFARFGWALAAKHAFMDHRLGAEMYWLSFVDTSTDASAAVPGEVLKEQLTYEDGRIIVGYIDSAPDWDTLRPFWELLRARSPTTTLRHGFEYLKRWWSRVGVLGELRMLVALRNGRPVAIAPMELTHVPWLGSRRRHLQFIASPPEIESVSLLVAPEDSEAVAAVADYIATRTDLWDSVVLEGQLADDPLLDPLAHRLRQRGLLVTTQEVGRRAGAFRADDLPGVLEDRLRRLIPPAWAMTLEFDGVVVPEALEEGLARYVALEEEVGADTCGVTRTSELYGFYLDLARRPHSEARMCFGYLESQGRDVAAIVGVADRESFALLHAIARTPMATDGPDGSEPMRVTLHAHGRNVSGMLMHGIYSVIKPRIKRHVGGGKV